jgi:hypothetical protein
MNHKVREYLQGPHVLLQRMAFQSESMLQSERAVWVSDWSDWIAGTLRHHSLANGGPLFVVRTRLLDPF